MLVYAAVGTGRDERKRLRALDLIESKDFATSAQVLQEFFVTVVKKKRGSPCPSKKPSNGLSNCRRFPCQPIHRELVEIAIVISERFLISYWDAAILAAATAQGAHIVYSEDLNDGQYYDTIRVVNPFAGGN